jgi:hypothetical protein
MRLRKVIRRFFGRPFRAQEEWNATTFSNLNTAKPFPVSDGPTTSGNIGERRKNAPYIVPANRESNNYLSDPDNSQNFRTPSPIPALQKNNPSSSSSARHTDILPIAALEINRGTQIDAANDETSPSVQDIDKATL